MNAGILFVYSNSTDCAVGARCFRGAEIHHAVYGEALGGMRFKLALLLGPPDSHGSYNSEGMLKRWVDEVIPLKMTPDGRVYRAYEA